MGLISVIVITFDLSSVCIGVTFVQLDDLKLRYGTTMAIIPEPPSPKDMGYTTANPVQIKKAGLVYKGFLKPGEVFISKAEAMRRSQEFRNARHNLLLRNIGKQCGHYLGQIKPQIVAIERNKSFNGILTTKLLAEIAGGIYFYCGARGIPLLDFDEATVRAKIRRDITDFSLEAPDGRTAIDTKWEIYCRLRSYFAKKHPGIFSFDRITMDESDSLAVFYYLYTTILQGEGAVNE